MDLLHYLVQIVLYYYLRFTIYIFASDILSMFKRYTNFKEYYSTTPVQTWTFSYLFLYCKSIYSSVIPFFIMVFIFTRKVLLFSDKISFYVISISGIMYYFTEVLFILLLSVLIFLFLISISNLWNL